MKDWKNQLKNGKIEKSLDKFIVIPFNGILL